MLTSLIEMLDLSISGHMTTSAMKCESPDESLFVNS